MTKAIVIKAKDLRTTEARDAQTLRKILKMPASEKIAAATKKLEELLMGLTNKTFKSLSSTGLSTLFYTGNPRSFRIDVTGLFIHGDNLSIEELLLKRLAPKYPVEDIVVLQRETGSSVVIDFTANPLQTMELCTSFLKEIQKNCFEVMEISKNMALQVPPVIEDEEDTDPAFLARLANGGKLPGLNEYEGTLHE